MAKHVDIVDEVRKILKKLKGSGRNAHHLSDKYGIAYSTIYKVSKGILPVQIRVLESINRMIKEEK